LRAEETSLTRASDQKRRAAAGRGGVHHIKASHETRRTRALRGSPGKRRTNTHGCKRMRREYSRGRYVPVCKTNAPLSLGRESGRGRGRLDRLGGGPNPVTA
jgi:hypothetical protein